MRGGQILWVQIVLLTIQAAMQWVTRQFGFQARLGEPLFVAAGWPIYCPPAFFLWRYLYDAYAPSIFAKGAIIMLGEEPTPKPLL